MGETEHSRSCPGCGRRELRIVELEALTGAPRFELKLWCGVCHAFFDTGKQVARPVKPAVGAGALAELRLFTVATITRPFRLTRA
jgi:hypothetical protein